MVYIREKTTDDSLTAWNAGKDTILPRDSSGRYYRFDGDRIVYYDKQTTDYETNETTYFDTNHAVGANRSKKLDEKNRQWQAELDAQAADYDSADQQARIEATQEVVLGRVADKRKLLEDIAYQRLIDQYNCDSRAKGRTCTDKAQKMMLEHGLNEPDQNRVTAFSGAGTSAFKRFQAWKNRNKKPPPPPPPVFKGTQEVRDQCLLMDHHELFKNPDAYENFVQVDNKGNPELFYTKATAPKGLNSFVQATSAELAGLVPYIKIWKVIFKEDGTQKEVALPFQNYIGNTDIQNIMQGKGSRGGGVGIQSFDWDLSGSNMIEAKKLIQSKLVLFFQDINDLNRCYDVGKEKVSYLDLIYKSSTTTGKCKHMDLWTEESYRMKIQVGWSAAPNDKLYEASQKTRYNFFLTMYSHDIEFKENGTILLTLNLMSQIEAALESPDADILLMDANETISALKSAECKLKEVGAQEDTDEEAAKDVKDAIEKLQKELSDEKIIKYNRFMDKLEEKKYLHWIEVSPEDIEMYLNGNSYNTNKWRISSPKDTHYKFKKKKYRVYYIYLGAIIETALSLFRDNDGKFEELRNIVGQIVINNSDGTPPIQKSLANIPISYNLFSKWFWDSCIKEQKSRWPLIKFLGSVVNKLFLPAVRTKRKAVIKSKIPHGRPLFRITPAGIPLKTGGICSLTGTTGAEQFNKWGSPELQSAADLKAGKEVTRNRINGENPFGSNQEENSGIPDEGKYLFFHVQNRQPDGLYECKDCTRTKRRERDAGMGVYHYRLGESRGLLKKINFSKMDFPELAASRIINQGRDGLGGIAEIYNANIDLVGNAIYHPGSYIYIDTSSTKGMGEPANEQSLSHKLGLGGYYMVIGVKSNIASGTFQTTLTCIFHSYGGPKIKKAPVKKVE